MKFDDLFDGSDTHLLPTHVVPVNDLREHDTSGTPCWCDAIEDDGVVIHNAMDERETYEEGRKPQ